MALLNVMAAKKTETEMAERQFKLAAADPSSKTVAPKMKNG